MLKFYNSLSKTIEDFTPLENNKVKMYVCGPTVYDKIHIGNARPIVFFDILYRYLKYLYKEVIYVRNITDIDDKIIQRAKEKNISIKKLTQETIKDFFTDISHLNVLDPTHQPKATDFIYDMIKMVNDLLENKFAYISEDYVLFDTEKAPNYGDLSKLAKKDIIHGARVEVAKYKKNPADFILWKPVRKDEEGWDSPWGYGRPGWHLECSAMAKHFLGESFDIHAGGIDLIFPHHENERAQSIGCCKNNNASAKYWLHNGFLMVEGNKMSKSLGNFITLNEALKKHQGEVIKLTLLSTHYRSPIDFKETSLTQAKNILNKAYKALLEHQDIVASDITPSKEFLSFLNDDLNTHLAINSLINKVNNLSSLTNKEEIKGQIIAESNILGLLQENPSKWLDKQKQQISITKEEIENLIEERIFAKKEKDFKKADTIRDNLLNQGIILEDDQKGTKWKIKDE